MTINIKRYVDITSGAGGGAIARQRELIGMFFTSNQRVAIDSFIEMESAAEVAAFFGANSEEAKRAFFYFDFISKTITRPKKIAFARFVNKDKTATIFGGVCERNIDNWRKIANGTLNFKFGSLDKLTNLNFSKCETLSDVAQYLQSEFIKNQKTLSASILTYDAISSRFNFDTLLSDIVIKANAPAGETDIGAYLGWRGADTIISLSAKGEEPLDAFLRAVERNNNFGSFAFIDPIANDKIIAVAKANSGRNVEFMYCVPVNRDNASILSAALIDLSGVCLTYNDNNVVHEYDEMAPMIVLASTDYERRNGTQNYMFQQFDLKAKVETAADANFYDNIRVNYMGVTQTAGQLIKFYQRGVMTGLATAPVDMNTYANEMWFKDAAASSLLTLLLAMPKVSANADGRGQVIAILQEAIDRALYNGTISVEKPISITQKLYIGQMTGDSEAWRQVQSVGYWLDCDMKSFGTKDGRTEWKATYILIYSKNDVVRKIEGTHTLI